MCKLHGVRLIKGIKIFESMLKLKRLRKRLGITSQNLIAALLLMCVVARH